MFACGRYEGIDQRVLDHAADRMPVREVSLGDYVLNGGEVAALAVIEAVVRLLPGFMGNPASLTEESHGGSGLLEYPVYTKPADLARPRRPAGAALAATTPGIAAWRHDQALRRTAERRPDLLHPSGTLSVAGIEDARRPHRRRPRTPASCSPCSSPAGSRRRGPTPTLDIPPLHETLDDVSAWLREWTTLRRAVRAAARRRGARAGSRATPGTSAG